MRTGLFALDPLPLSEGLPGIGHHAVSEYVRVPAGHLVADPLDHIIHRELAGLGPELTMEDDLEEQVPELFHQVIPRALIDGVARPRTPPR